MPPNFLDTWILVFECEACMHGIGAFHEVTHVFKALKIFGEFNFTP